MAEVKIREQVAKLPTSKGMLQLILIPVSYLEIINTGRIKRRIAERQSIDKFRWVQ